ncbi:hypothetical protein MKX03_024195 [Papaver bracteatum]|nr:hypothetical protein MKX03_024195 [Papaver bracteatum]
MEESGPLKRALIDAAAGAISGGLSRTVTSPLDVIKIRFQVQLEPTSSWELLRKRVHQSSKYTGMMQATKAILREEGLPGFWRGNVPGLLMVMPYTSIQFTVLHKIKTFVSGSSKAEDHVHLSPHLSYVSGALAGCAATRLNRPQSLDRGSILTSESLSCFQLFVCGLASSTCARAIVGLPRDLKYGARVEHHAYNGMINALRCILATEGWAGLYKGIALIPSVIKAAPAGAVTFAAYEYTSEWLESHSS